MLYTSSPKLVLELSSSASPVRFRVILRSQVVFESSGARVTTRKRITKPEYFMVYIDQMMISTTEFRQGSVE